MESYSTLFSAWLFLFNKMFFYLHLYCCVCQFVPFYCWVVFHWLDTRQFVFLHSLIDGCLCCFQGLAITNKSAKNLLEYPMLEGFIISYRKAILSIFLSPYAVRKQYTYSTGEKISKVINLQAKIMGGRLGLGSVGSFEIPRSQESRVWKAGTEQVLHPSAPSCSGPLCTWSQHGIDSCVHVPTWNRLSKLGPSSRTAWGHQIELTVESAIQIHTQFNAKSWEEPLGDSPHLRDLSSSRGNSQHPTWVFTAHTKLTPYFISFFTASFHILSITYLSWIINVLSLQKLNYLTFTATLRARSHYYPHFMIEEIGTERLSNLPELCSH